MTEMIMKINRKEKKSQGKSKGSGVFKLQALTSGGSSGRRRAYRTDSGRGRPTLSGTKYESVKSFPPPSPKVGVASSRFWGSPSSDALATPPAFPLPIWETEISPVRARGSIFGGVRSPSMTSPASPTDYPLPIREAEISAVEIDIDPRRRAGRSSSSASLTELAEMAALWLNAAPANKEQKEEEGERVGGGGGGAG